MEIRVRLFGRRHPLQTLAVWADEPHAEETTQFGGLFLGGLHPNTAVPALLRVYPHARAVVAVPNRRVAREWLGRLQDAGLPQPVLAARDLNRSWDGGPKVVVNSFDGLDHAQRHDFDLAIVPDARPLVGVGSRRG